jgi:sugar/nucleoside kinase (ribokinase family)
MNFDLITVGASLIDLVAMINHFPDSDDEVFIPKMNIEFGGSAANTAVACARLGLRTMFFGKIGDDFFGQMILNKFKEENVNTSLIVKTRNNSTGICFIAVDKLGDRRMFAHSGAANEINSSDLKDDSILKRIKVLYLASLQNTKVLSELAKKAKGYGTSVVLNPGALIVNQGLDIAKPILFNTDIYISSLNEAERLFNTNELVITLGKKGCYVADEKSSYKIPSIKVKVKDTTGAGDAFTAGFLAAKIKQAKLHDCGLAGIVTAAMTIREIGARNGLPKIEEIKEFIIKNNIDIGVFK